MVDNNKKPSKIFTYLSNSLGEDLEIGERRIYQIAKEFKDQDRISIERKEGSGQKVVKRIPDNINAVLNLIEDDPNLSIQSISEQLDLSWSTVQRILKDDLHKISLYTRWVPHTLAQSQKQERVEKARRMQRTLTKTVIVIDEKWVYFKPTPPQQNVRAWVDQDGERPQMIKRSLTNQKSMIIVAIDFTGNFYFEILDEKQTIDSQKYQNFLQNMIENIDKCKYVIMHDNARPHKSRIVQQFLKQNKIVTVSQPPYSPDFNLLDRYIFRNMEQNRCKTTFSNSDEIMEFVQNFLDNITKDQLQSEFKKLKQYIQSVISSQGEYVY